MAIYESFETTKNKIRKSWESSERNESGISNLLTHNVDFNSISFSKGIIEIKLLEDYLIQAGENKVTTTTLLNFPEWIINHINVISIINSTDGFPLINIVDDPTTVFNNGLLAVNDITINRNHHYWIAKLDGNNYELKVFNNPNLRRVSSVSEFGFGTEAIPMFLNLSIKIQNPRIYENNRKNKI